jgi:hypothetical protein
LWLVTGSPWLEAALTIAAMPARTGSVSRCQASMTWARWGRPRSPRESPVRPVRRGTRRRSGEPSTTFRGRPNGQYEDRTAKIRKDRAARYLDRARYPSLSERTLRPSLLRRTQAIEKELLETDRQGSRSEISKKTSCGDLRPDPETPVLRPSDPPTCEAPVLRPLRPDLRPSDPPTVLRPLLKTPWISFDYSRWPLATEPLATTDSSNGLLVHARSLIGR